MCLGAEAQLLLNFPHTGLALSTALHQGMVTARLLVFLFVCFPGLLVAGSFGSFRSVARANSDFPSAGVLINVVAAAVNTG